MKENSKLNRALFQILFNNSKINAIVLMDKNGTILSINKAFTGIFGYTESMIVGKNTKIFYTAHDNEEGLPEKEIKKVIAEGQASDKNYFVKSDGSVTWVSGESVYSEDTEKPIIFKIIQDIQDEKNAEDEKKKLNEFNEKILSSIEDVVIVLNEELQIVQYNQSFINLFRTGKIGNEWNFAELIKAYDKENNLIQDIENSFRNRKGFSKVELEIDSATGDKKYFNITCSILADEVPHALLVVHNITAHKLAQRQREDIIGFVAHELRNPLANIILCNDLLDDLIKEKNVEASIDLLSRSKSSVMRLNKMVSELYDVTKISGGNLSLEKSRFSFDEMVQEAILTVQVLYPSYKIQVSGSVNKKIYADKFRLIQVITNYISNGIKYSLGNEVVELHVEKQGDEIILQVTDRGLGIDKSQLPQIFSRFFRAEKTKNLEGAGLGLYLCKQIIDAHNGRVWVISEEGKGSTFYFSLPINDKE